MNRFLLVMFVVLVSFILVYAQGTEPNTKVLQTQQEIKAMLGRAPRTVQNKYATNEPFISLLGVNGPAYGSDVFNSRFIKFWLNAPSTTTLMGPNTMDLYCGDFDALGVFYAIDNATSNLVTVDTSSGVATIVGTDTVTRQAGHIWTGMSWDETTSTMYASSTDGVTSALYTVDLTTPSSSLVGTNTTVSLLIDIAVDPQTGQMYGHDLSDQIFLIDKTNFTATVLGPTGFDASYAQGMDFNPEDGELYLASFNFTNSNGELRLVNLTNGNAALIGPIGAGLYVEVAAFGIVGAAEDILDPNPPTNFNAYSDYTTPTSMDLTWTDPTEYVNGDPLTNFQIIIARDAVVIDSVAMGIETYADAGLNDGQLYAYDIWTKDNNDSTSTTLSASWTAGGAGQPMPPTNHAITDPGGGMLRAHWTNPTTNIDGTPMDDFDAIKLYENNVLLTTFARSPGDTSLADSADFTPSEGTNQYWVTVVDNESPPNESDPSNIELTPVPYPFSEGFEEGLGDFANDPANGVNWTTTTNYFVGGVASAWNAYNNSNINIIELSGALDLTGATGAKFSFYQICKTEGGFDFGYVEYSTDGGVTWASFPLSSYEGSGIYTNERFDEDSYTIWGTTNIPPVNGWWQLEIFDLASFIGETSFKIRFRLTTDATLLRYGWLIDDVSIRQASWPNPPTNLFITSETGGDLMIHWTNPSENVGGSPLDDFDAINLYEDDVLLTTFARSPADTGSLDSAVFTPSAPNLPYYLTAVDNETPPNESAPSNTVYKPFSAPYTQDFETAIPPSTLPVQWTNDQDDDFDWTADAGGTPSNGTGPTVDHTTGTASGIYMYTETSVGVTGDVANLTSPFIDLSDISQPGMSFWYHMHGATMGELHVDVFSDGVWNLDVIPPLIGEQQPNQTDPWKQAVVDLSAYAASLVQVRFRGIRGSGFESDMAIDDVSIRQASWPIPPTNLFITSEDGGDLMIHWTNPSENVGGSPLDDFDAINLYEDDVLLTTFARSPTDTGSLDSAVFTPSAPNLPYYLTAVDNEIPHNESAPSNTVYKPFSAPYTQNFEAATPGTPGVLPLQWANETDDDFDWYVDDGGTPSSGTGPILDHTFGTTDGNYMFTEASPQSAGDEAHLTTSFIDLSTVSSPALIFWYHMHGTAMGELHVDVYANGVWNLDVMPPFIGEQQPNQTDPWKQTVVDLSAYGSSLVQVRFRGIRGSGFESDMAIDDVYFGAGVTGVENPINLPTAFALKPNYPNPFNPTTTIKYQLPQMSNVRLVIYNVLGQKVRTLINRQVEPGYHSIFWDGRNDSGKQVATGLYIYRFEASDYVKTMKMMLLK